MFMALRYVHLVRLPRCLSAWLRPTVSECMSKSVTLISERASIFSAPNMAPQIVSKCIESLRARSVAFAIVNKET
jgi:hypothetical protein